VTLLRWGILGTGAIARVFGRALVSAPSCELVAVASRSSHRAHTFAREFDIPSAYGSYEELLKDPSVSAVYIAVPHARHAEWAVRAANAGKHLLCEKPLAINFREASAIVDAARSNDVFLMEAFLYRCHPQTEVLLDLLRRKVIGDVCVIHASFGFRAERDAATAAARHAMGAGGILDVGCYPVSMARLIVGAVGGHAFADPSEVLGVGQLNEAGIDEWAVGCLKFAGGIVAQVACGVHVGLENAVRIFGSEGDIFIPSPWVPGGREAGVTRILVRSGNEKSYDEIVTETRLSPDAIEAEAVADNILGREIPMMTWRDSLGNMRTLDRWRQAVGVKYPADEPALSA
jgi:predicted dehydrogenase